MSISYPKSCFITMNCSFISVAKSIPSQVCYLCKLSKAYLQF